MRTTSLRRLPVLIALGAFPAHAEDVVVSGHVGYLSEWEVTAAARAAASGSRTEFAGPLLMKHTGACTPNGAVEKRGEIRFWRTGLLSSKIEGTIKLENEQCTFEMQQSSDAGLMRCPGKGGVPLSIQVKEPTRREKGQLRTAD